MASKDDILFIDDEGDTGPPLCQVCGALIEDESNMFRCPRCDTPHHLDCWTYFGGCSTYGCKETVQRYPSAIGKIEPAYSTGLFPPATDDDERRDHQHSRRHYRAVSRRKHRSVIDPSRLLRYDLDTPLETFLTYTTIILAITSICSFFGWASGGVFGPAFAYSIGLCVIFAITRMSTDCTYLLDLQKRAVLYSRSILGANSQHHVCDFDDIAAITIRGDAHDSSHNRWWYYSVALVTKDCRTIALSDKIYENFEATCSIARQLAKVTHSHFERGASQRMLIVDRNPETDLPVITHEIRAHETVFAKDLTWVVVCVVMLLVEFIIALF